MVPAVVIIAASLVARFFFVPSDFGLWGHYRASSVIQNAEQPISYAGSEACAGCHDEVVGLKKTGYHKGLSCETCHGPSSVHAEDPEKVRPFVPRARSNCLLCHDYQPSRPTGFPQVVADSHNPTKQCIACHRPHDPKPPEVPKGCEACHAKIQHVLGVSRHASLGCTICHETPKQHNLLPREYPPRKLQSREFCGKCHGQDSQGAQDIPKVNMANHGQKYLCWECHYPHMPEAQ